MSDESAPASPPVPPSSAVRTPAAAGSADTQATTDIDGRLRALTRLLAVACGLGAANLYYAQPLLDVLATTFDVDEGTVALVVTVTQLGYAAGLVLVLPLGDRFESRGLATRVLLLTALALLTASAAPTLAVFLAAGVAIGATSVVTQILVPLAAHLAPEARRGEVVGRVMSGLLVGVLLARTVSSVLADAFGWRAVYVASAVAMLTLSVVLRRMLPRREPDLTLPYTALLRSTARLLRTERVLRRRTLYQVCMFGSFSVYWTAIAYQLADVHHLSQTQIGLFALAGAGGVIAAPLAGRAADRGWTTPVTGVVLVTGAAASVLGGLAANHLLLLALAGVLLDASVQTAQVTGQQALYTVRPDARSRINTVFIASLFLGGAAGSAASGLVYAAYGWHAVAALGAALPAVAAAAWVWHTWRDRVETASAASVAEVDKAETAKQR